MIFVKEPRGQHAPSYNKETVWKGGISMRLEVEKVLDKIRPALQADGGDVELVDVEGGW